MLKIFSGLFKAINEYTEIDILGGEMLINVFYALTHKFDEATGKWRKLNSLEELIGTQDAECRKKARKIITDIISLVFSTCGKNGKYLAKLKPERRSYLISSFDGFLRDCEKYLEDIEKWKVDLDLLQKQINVLE